MSATLKKTVLRLHDAAMEKAAFGELDAAISLWERAFTLAPYHLGFYIPMTRVKPEGPHVDRLLELEASEVPPEYRVAYHFSMNRVRYAQGEHKLAFAHAAQANALHRTKISYDEAHTIGYFERMPQVFTPLLMRDFAWCSTRSHQPIFIVGLPRSGTTLVEQILASHPEVTGLGELYTLNELVSQHHTLTDSWSCGSLYALGSQYLAHADMVGTTYFTDKMPGNTRFLGLIRLALRGATVIHCRRNMADTALSYFSELFTGGHQWSYDLEELGRYIVAHERMMNHWRDIGVPMLEVQYETLCGNPEAETRRMLDRVGLTFDERCLDHSKTTRAVRSASLSQVRKKIYTSSIGRWQSVAEELTPLLRIFDAAGIDY